MTASRSSDWRLASVMTLGPKLGTDALVGEQLQQERVRSAPVDDVCRPYAAMERLHGRLELGPHPAGDLHQALAHLGGRGLGDPAVRILWLPPPALHVREEDQLVPPEPRRAGARRGVGVDVVGLPLAVG